MRSVARSLTLALLVAGATSGCSVLPVPTAINDADLPVGVRVVTPPERLVLEVANGTTIPVDLNVNGRSVAEVGPHSQLGFTVRELGPLPWQAEIRAGSGRVLLEVAIRDGAVWRQRNQDGSTTSESVFARVDLSCGRIDAFAGTPPRGPPPGPGAPGDCDP